MVYKLVSHLLISGTRFFNGQWYVLRSVATLFTCIFFLLKLLFTFKTSCARIFLSPFCVTRCFFFCCFWVKLSWVENCFRFKIKTNFVKKTEHIGVKLLITCQDKRCSNNHATMHFCVQKLFAHEPCGKQNAKYISTNSNIFFSKKNTKGVLTSKYKHYGNILMVSKQ